GATILVASVLFGGCMMSGQADNPFQGRSARQITLHVNNQSSEQVTLRAVSIGGRPALGTVQPLGNANFTVPWTRTTELSIEISSLGSRRFTTRAIVANPGDRVQLRIERTISRSILW
ncbi:MAG: hypothetical protein WDZ89_04405, partial [Gemmatimonadota bacterium]